TPPWPLLWLCVQPPLPKSPPFFSVFPSAYLLGLQHGFRDEAMVTGHVANAHFAPCPEEVIAGQDQLRLAQRKAPSRQGRPAFALCFITRAHWLRRRAEITDHVPCPARGS